MPFFSDHVCSILACAFLTDHWCVVQSEVSHSLWTMMYSDSVFLEELNESVMLSLLGPIVHRHTQASQSDWESAYRANVAVPSIQSAIRTMIKNRRGQMSKDVLKATFELIPTFPFPIGAPQDWCATGFYKQLMDKLQKDWSTTLAMRPKSWVCGLVSASRVCCCEVIIFAFLLPFVVFLISIMFDCPCVLFYLPHFWFAFVVVSLLCRSTKYSLIIHSK